MENQINIYTNEIMDKLVSESEFALNSLCLMFPISYAMNLVELNWNDIYFAYINGYINNSDVIYFAIDEKEKGCSNETIIDLAYLNANSITKDELIYDYFFKLIKPKEDVATKDKLLYILLHFLYDKRKWFEDPFQAIEVIYADFSYPSNIQSLVRFMPIAEGNNTYSSETDRLNKNWEIYLQNQARFYRDETREQSGDQSGDGSMIES